MATETVTKNPSKKRAQSKLNAASRKTKPTVLKTKSTPIVDVPATKDDDVISLIKATKVKVDKYLKTNFDGVDKKMIELVTKECAECVVYKRTARKHDSWDKTIIEEVILSCFPAANEEQAVEAKKIAKKAAPTKKAVAKKADSVKKVVAKKASPTKKAVAKKVAPTKKAVKKVTAKKAAKKAVKATAKKVASKMAPARTGGADLKEMKAAVKKAKGAKKFELACAVLKKEKKIWMQAQDIPTVADHLFKVHTGKAKLVDKLAGKGEKDYAKRRLVNTLNLIKELI